MCLKGGDTEKDWPKRPSDHQLQEVLKKTDQAIILVAEAVRVPAHLAPPGSLQAKKLHHLHAQSPLGQNCHRQKQVLHLWVQSHLSSVRLFETQ